MDEEGHLSYYLVFPQDPVSEDLQMSIEEVLFEGASSWDWKPFEPTVGYDSRNTAGLDWNHSTLEIAR